MARELGLVRDLEAQVGYENIHLEVTSGGSYSEHSERKIYLELKDNPRESAIEYAYELTHISNSPGINALYERADGGEITADQFVTGLAEFEVYAAETRARVAPLLGYDPLSLDEGSVSHGPEVSYYARQIARKEAIQARIESRESSGKDVARLEQRLDRTMSRETEHALRQTVGGEDAPVPMRVKYLQYYHEHAPH